MTPEETERDRAPERIWIDAERTYSATSFSAGIKYIRADLHDAEVQRLTRERDAALALVAAAYEAAAQVAADWGNGFAQKNNHYGTAATRVAAIIRRMLPADALAAQAARDERMRAEGRAEAEARGRLRGIEEAADKFRDCWDDPEAEDDGFAHNTEVAIRALGERGRLCRQPDDIKTR